MLPVLNPTPAQGEDTVYGSTYEDISANAKSFVQFGVSVSNTSTGDIQLCRATLRIEPKQAL